ncbi:MAG: hypothetical protein Q9217_004397 [Psora testacea]
MRKTHLLWLLGSCIAVDAFAITATPAATPVLKKRAIVPTTAGQIGINPVEEELGEATQYVAEIGTDTGLLTLQDSTTHWIGVNTEYLTLDTITTTVNGAPTTTTSTVSIKVATATAAAHGQSPALQCLIGSGTKASADGGVFDDYGAVDWEAMGLEIAETADALLVGAIQALSKSQKAKFIVWMAAAAGGGMLAGKVVGKINIPKIGFGAPASVPDQPTPSNSQPATSASASCAPSGSPDRFSQPLCKDNDCKSENQKTCALDPKKNCACLLLAEDPDPQWYDKSYFDIQQEFIANISAGIFDPAGYTASTTATVSATNSGGASTTSASTWYGPTTVTIGLSPGGGDYTMTISAGCYAPSPSYNYVPETTCTSGVTSSSTSQPASSSTSPSIVSNRPHPAASPICSDNSAKSIDQWVKDGSGNRVTPKSLFYNMRQTLCSNNCGAVENVPSEVMVATPVNDGCEIAIALSSDVEIYAYRGTSSTGAQWQDCWDSFANITETCIQRGPNTGWVPGPDEYQFSQAGIRILSAHVQARLAIWQEKSVVAQR